MVITKSFYLDINTPWKAPTLYIKQGDVDSRKLQATIRKDGTNYSIPGDVFATFRMHKPDDTFVTQDCTISGSVVSVVMDAQCATAAGHAKAEIVLATAGEVVSTFLLAIEVMPAAVTDGDIESRDSLGEYRTILEEMLRVKGSPLVANTAAEMTDTDRVYVYTGSEVGYVNGSWYYYDGAAWTLGGVYNSQGIGLAYQQEVAQMVKQSAIASESDSTPYLYRPTPNSSAILADEEIVGGTIAFNQLCNSASVTVPNGHKYYLLKAGVSSITASTGSAVTGLDDGTDMVIDLTAMLGSQIADYLYTLESGTAGAGVAKLREWGFLSKDYFAYDAGSLKSVNTSGKRVTGFNLFDKSTVSAGYINDSSGNFTPSPSDLASDYISVIPNVSYFIDSDQTAGAWGAWYDADKNYISGISYYTARATDAQKTKTAPTNAHFMRLTVVRTGNGNIDTFCVSVANPATNHVRKPYRQPTTYPTTPTDLNGIFKLDSNNQLYADGDVYAADGTVTRRYAAIDMGSLSWGYNSNGYLYTSITGKTPGNFNLLCARYITTTATTTGDMLDKEIKGNAGNTAIYVKDSAYTDGAVFKTAMNGVYLVYELATPATDTADTYPATQIAGSKEEWIDNRAVPVPVGHRTQYSIGVPDVPASGSNLVLKATSSGGKTTLKWE